MCGIAGIVNLDSAPVDSDLLVRMATTLAHRGPDGEGFVAEGPVGLAHKRLAVIDLSCNAAQPMANEDGSLLLVFNGEIYGFPALRRELEAAGHIFKSHSDTEVILHGYEEWGEDVVHHLNGMFAFALWDSRTRSLFVARDRYGIKPFYYTISRGRFLFGSEIKALLAADGWNRQVDPDALVEYFTFQNILTDRTLFDGIRLLPPATTGRIGLGDRELTTQRFWNPVFAVDEGLADHETARLAVREALEDAVSRQVVSDVPVGSFLSGGMDSGSLVALATQHIEHLTTFTGGFDLSLATGIEQHFDERHDAERMAALFNTDHYMTVLHPGGMPRVMPALIWHLEDLRVGMSYQNWYITHLASKFARVCLSGAGGDELFAGYPWRYPRLIGAESPDEFDAICWNQWQRLVPHAELSDFLDPRVLSARRGPETNEIVSTVLADAPTDGWSSETALNRTLYFELKTFLHGLLVLEDKISSAHALETRVPFLDNRMVDVALSVPAHMKLDLSGIASRAHELGGETRFAEGKTILRQAMKGLIPDDVLTRAKQGFSTPEASWYRADSMDYIRGILLAERTLERGYFNRAYIERVVDEQCTGAANRRLLIWSLLSFEWWNRLFVDGESSQFEGRA